MSRSTKSTGRKSVTALNREFERAHAAFKAIPSSKDKRWEPASDRCYTAAGLVVATPAETINEMLIKTRAIVWMIEGEKIVNIAAWRPNRMCDETAGDCLASLGRDLDRIAKRLNVAA